MKRHWHLGVSRIADEIEDPAFRRTVHDRLIDARFTTLEDGRRVFLEPGFLGVRRGYVILTADQEAVLRARLREGRRRWVALYFLAYPVVLTVFALQGFMDWPFWQQLLLMAALFCVLWIWSHLEHRPVTRNLERIAVPKSPISLAARWRTAGRTIHPARFFLGLLGSGAMAGLLMWVFVTESKPIALLFALFFLVWMIPPSISLRSWWRSLRE